MRKRGWLFLGAVALAVFMLVIAALPGREKTVAPFAPFERAPADRAVISSGSDGWPTFMADPCVIRDDEGYHAFFTNLFLKKNGRYWYSFDPANIEAFDFSRYVGATAYAFSDDRGLTWTIRETPCAAPDAEPWREDQIETPFVFQDGGQLVLFYCALGSRGGEKFDSRYQIGAATLDLGGKSIRARMLDDQASFTLRPEPVLPYVTDRVHHHNNTQEPSIVVKDGALELFYVGLTLKLPGAPINAPGQRITKVAMYKAVLDRDLNVVENSDAPLIDTNITEAHYRDGVYHVFSTQPPPWYAGFPGKSEGLDSFHHGEYLAYYRSNDGVTWSGPQTILRPGPEGTFDDWGIMAPTVVFEEDRVVLFYTAWQHAAQPASPPPPDGRFGMARGPDHVIWGTLGRAEAVLQSAARHAAD